VKPINILAAESLIVFGQNFFIFLPKSFDTERLFIAYFMIATTWSSKKCQKNHCQHRCLKSDSFAKRS